MRISKIVLTQAHPFHNGGLVDVLGLIKDELNSDKEAPQLFKKIDGNPKEKELLENNP